MRDETENIMRDSDYRYLLEKAIEAQTRGAESLALAARAMERSADTSKSQEMAFNKLTDANDRQTTAIVGLQDTFQRGREFLTSWYVKAFMLILLLLFIAVGGGTIIREARDSGIFKIFTGGN